MSSNDYGKTATITADIINNVNGSCGIMMGASSNKNSTTISINSQGTFSVSYIIQSDDTQLECLIPTFSGVLTGLIYVDNIKFNIQ